MVATEVITHKVGTSLIPHRMTDGFVNGTFLCAACGKFIADYLRLESTKEFLVALSRSMGIPTDLLVVKVVNGKNEDRGTWVHPKVAIHLAQWCSPAFAVLVTDWVFDWMTKGAISVPNRPPVYVTRLALSCKMQAGVPDGYWTVFEKAAHLLILVECELKCPVEKYDLLDGSTGIMYGKYRIGKDWIRPAIRYQHIFPDNRGVQLAWAYHLDELKHFDLWLRVDYTRVHLPIYLDGKYNLPEPAAKMIARATGIRRIEGN